MLDVLLLDAIASGLMPAPAVALLRAQNDLHAFKLAESALNASVQIRLIGTPAGRHTVLDATRLEALPIPLWVENTNPATRTKEGFLIEAQGEGAWAVSSYAETEDSFATAARVVTLTRNPDGSIRVQRGPTSRADEVQLQEFGKAVLAKLAIVLHPEWPRSSTKKHQSAA